MEHEELGLVPVPREVKARSGTFVFLDSTQIVLPAAEAQLYLNVARRLKDAVMAETGIASVIVMGERGGDRQRVVMLAVDPEQVVEDQGYVLDIGPDRVAIVGHDAPGIFYGVCTLIQLVRRFGAQLPCLCIGDHPDFVARGVMLDVSRCKVPTLDSLLRWVDWLAGLKINQVQLYTEHTFAYRDHRDVWVNASPLTGEDILELDAYCRERFVELVPNQNSFGHLAHWLSHPRYNDLAEAPDGFDWPWGGRSEGPFSLNPADPRSLDLLRSMYDDLLPHFSSRLFNVGCDETFDLGMGRSKALCDQQGVHRVYLDFLLQIYQLVKARGRTMMFWGDIILHQPELIPELPKDVIALEWGYEFDHPFDDHCRKFAEAGIPFYVCPGTSSWNAIVGRTENAIGNLRSAADYGLRNGAVGYLNTDWGDNGHWQYLPTAYLGYLYGAAVAWSFQASADLDVASALSAHAFMDPSGTMGRLAFDLGNVYQVYERITGQRIHNANFLVQVLYQPVEELVSRRWDWQQVDPGVFEVARQEILDAMSRMSQARMRLPDASLIRREYENAARMLLVACALGEFKVAMASDRGTAGGKGLSERANALAEELRSILAEHRDLWLARNRVGGLEEGSGRHFQQMVDACRQLARDLGSS
jgi:hexosaminidase